MGKDNGLNLTNEVQKTYWDYIIARSKEYINNNLTGRLIIDFQRGIINQLQDQAIIAGTSVLSYNLSKFNE